MARYKEAAVLILDVGQHMSTHLPALRRSAFLLAETKLLNHAAHEVAVVLFGANDTDNAIHEEFGPGDDQYTHITVLQPLACPDMQALARINEIQCEQGRSDHVSALLVAADLLKKATVNRPALAKARKRLLLISSFDAEVDDLDDEMRDQIAQELVNAGISLEAYGAGDGGCGGAATLPQLPPAQGEPAGGGGGGGEEEQAALLLQRRRQARAANLACLLPLLEQAGGTYAPLPREADMAALFPSKATAPSPRNLTLMVGTSLRIHVQAFKKTAKERLPPLKMFSEPTTQDGTGLVKRDTEYRAPSNPDQTLQPGDMARAYRYGQQLVPVRDVDELVYRCGKCLELLGFADRADVPRWHYCAEAYVLLGHGGPDALALSALARALQREGRVAVLRMCVEERYGVALYAGTPLLPPEEGGGGGPLLPGGGGPQADALVLNRLPFSDDLRPLRFPSFHSDEPQRQHLRPTQEQKHAMRQLVDSLRLAPAGPGGGGGGGGSSGTTQTAPSQAAAGPARELLVPEETLNPSLQRFYWFMGQRALDPDFEVPDAAADLVAASVLDQPPPESLPPAARAALEALPKVFHVMAPAPAPAPAGDLGAAAEPGAALLPAVVAADEGGVRLVAEVDTAQPLVGFSALLGAGQVERAFSGLQAAVVSLVDNSLGARNYAKAADCLAEMRAAAVQQAEPRRYNDALEALRARYAQAADRRPFWLSLMRGERRLGPVGDDEAPGAGMSAAAAAEYVRLHGEEQAAAPEPPRPEVIEVLDEDDEFAGME